MRTADIRASLVVRRREVLARYHRILRRAENELATHATAPFDAHVLSTLSHADLRELVAVTEAIQRIDDGDDEAARQARERVTSTGQRA